MAGDSEVGAAEGATDVGAAEVGDSVGALEPGFAVTLTIRFKVFNIIDYNLC